MRLSTVRVKKRGGSAPKVILGKRRSTEGLKGGAVLFVDMSMGDQPIGDELSHVDRGKCLENWRDHTAGTARYRVLPLPGIASATIKSIRERGRAYAAFCNTIVRDDAKIIFGEIPELLSDVQEEDIERHAVRGVEGVKPQVFSPNGLVWWYYADDESAPAPVGTVGFMRQQAPWN